MKILMITIAATALVAAFNSNVAQGLFNLFVATN